MTVMTIIERLLKKEKKKKEIKKACVCLQEEFVKVCAKSENPRENATTEEGTEAW